MGLYTAIQAELNKAIERQNHKLAEIEATASEIEVVGDDIEAIQRQIAPYVPSYAEMERKLDEIELAMMSRRLDTLERSLLHRNATTDRILAACRRIRWYR